MQNVDNMLILPEGTRSVEEEAFFGDTSISDVHLKDGIESIGVRAFADSGITSVYLPASITEIADDAFEGCTEMLTATVFRNSFAETYCREHNIRYVYAGSQYVSGYTGLSDLNHDLCEIGNRYLDSDGYCIDGLVNDLLIEIGEAVKKAYDQGLVSDYTVGRDLVWWHETESGRLCAWHPKVEGTQSGGNDAALSIMTFEPFTEELGSIAGVPSSITNEIFS